MKVNVFYVKFTTKVGNRQSAKATSFKGRTNQKLTLKEMRRKDYSFLNSGIFENFEELFHMNVLELLEMKQPDEASMIDD